MSTAHQRVVRLERRARRDARRRASHRHRGLSSKEMRQLYFGEGGNPLDVWKRASHGQRVRIKRRAAREGTTVEGWIRGGPKALRERSRAGITASARRTIGTAYAPEEADLRDEDKRIRNLEAKHETDQKYYDQWLTTRSAEIDQAARTADAAVLASAQKEQELVGQRYQQEGQRRQAFVAGQGGNVSGTQQGQYQQFDTSSEEQRAAERQAAVGTRAREAVATGTASRATGRQAVLAQSLENIRRFRQDERDALTDLGKKWKDMNLRRSGDIAKEIARLNTEELTKAQGTRDFNLASNKLGVEAADKAAKNKIARQKYGLDVKKYRAKLTVDRANTRIKQINNRIKQGNLDERTRHDLISERNELRRINKKGTGAGGKRSKKYRTDYNKAYSLIRIAAGPKRGKSGGGNIGSHTWRQGILDTLVGRGLDRRAVRDALKRYHRRHTTHPRRHNAKGGPHGTRPT